MDGKNLILYCIHLRISTNYRSLSLLRKELIGILGKSYHIPKNLRNDVIKEMEKLELIKNNCPRRGHIEILKGKNPLM